MLLFKKILLFILSLFFIILFFNISSISYAKSKFNAETNDLINLYYGS